jgi:hypothetical protein
VAGEPLDLTEVVRTGTSAALDDVYVARPGKVTAYDPLTNTAVVKPMVKRALYAVDDDERSYEELPEIPFVPVAFPRAGDCVVTLPVAVGDTVLLVFCDVSLAEWRDSGELSEPVDARRHSLGWPTAIPGLFADNAPLSADPVDVAARVAGMVLGQHAGNGRIEITPSTIKLGKDATDYVALAAFVDDRISTIVSKFNAHTHAVSGTAAAAVVVGQQVPAQTTVAATRTKAK